MHKYIFSIGLLMASLGSLCGEDETRQEQASEIQDYDRQIEALRREIARYNNVAAQLDRKESRLRSRDFSGARRIAVLRDRCREIAADLQRHLEQLERDQKAAIEAQSKQEKK